jgi:hypothetical protein
VRHQIHLQIADLVCVPFARHLHRHFLINQPLHVRIPIPPQHPYSLLAPQQTVIDKVARKQYAVEPRAYEGRLLHQLPAVRTAFGDAYAELYLAEPADSCRVALTRAGTRVLEDLATLAGLEHAPWSSRYLQGLIDVPFLNLTPSTRSGIIHDERYAALCEALQPLKAHLNGLIEAQQRAEEEQASQQSLRAIQRAFREALLALPPEEYDWFDIQARAPY